MKQEAGAKDYWNVEPETVELMDCIFSESAKVSRNLFFRHTLSGFMNE
jgi:hypothetical protein